jgi:hypothetical protein
MRICSIPKASEMPSRSAVSRVTALALTTLFLAAPAMGWTADQNGSQLGPAGGAGPSAPVDFVLVELGRRAVSAPLATPVAPPDGGAPPPPPSPPAAGTLITESVPTMLYEPGRAIRGHAGCNRYSAEMVQHQVGSTRSRAPLFPVIALSKMACAPARMQLERRFVEALRRTVQITPRGNELLLQDARGRRLARFRSISARVAPL